MELIYLILSMTLPIAGGTFFVRWLLSSDFEMGRVEAITFGIGLGFGFTTFGMLLLGLIGVPFTRGAVGLPVLVLTLIFFVLSRKRVKSLTLAAVKGQGLRGWRLYLTIIMASWVALKAGFVSYESLTRPVYSIDSLVSWSILGKFFFYKAGFLLDTSNEHFFGSGYRTFLGHPLHLPLLQTWIALALGKFHEVYVKAPGAIYFIGVLGVLYYGVKREAGPLYSLITLFFMASVPIFTAHGQDAYADLPLCFFAISGTVALWRFFRGDSLPYIVLSGILFAMSMFVKNEGLFFTLAGGTALLAFLFSRKRSFVAPLAAFIIPIILIAGPWILIKYHYGIGFGHSGVSSGFKWFSDPTFHNDNTNYGVHWEVLKIGFFKIFFTANYNLIFPIWIIASLTAARTVLRTKLKYLYLMIFLVISMFLFVYLTLEVTAVTQETGIHRNTLTYLPIVYFITALVISVLWPDQGRGEPESPPSASCPPPLTVKPSDDIL
ncbi:MAG: ArnT family glycosyltransferase [Thermodesulfobacteriota bacterium]